MADALQMFMLLWYDFTDDEEAEDYLNFLGTEHETEILFLLNFNLKRVCVPRVPYYVENVVNNFIEEDYRTHYRVSQRMFMEILNIIRNSLIFDHHGGSEQLSPEKQLLVFLCYMANTETMREMGHYFGVGKSTIHVTVIRVMKLFVQTFIHVIRWPNVQQQDEVAREFQLQSGLPDVIGCLDGTHIRLAYCPKGDRDYINRKYFPSMQLQLVADANLFITDAYTGWPGSTHDARVLRNSSLYRKGEDGDLVGHNKIIAADSAYPIHNWLITPFRDNGHLNAQQKRFNRVFSSCRVTVERAIGHLKGRFRRLTNITIHSAHNIALTIISGCILHNLCILSHEDVEQYIIADDGNNHPNQFLNMYQDNPDGVQRRQQLMQRLP